MKSYTVVLSPEPNMGGYSVTVPALPGAVSQGATREEAVGHIRESMEAWLEVTHERGADALEETPDLVAREIRRILGFRSEEGWPLLVETAVVAISVTAAA